MITSQPLVQKAGYLDAGDITHDLPWIFLRMRFSYWLKADDAWHSLATAYLVQGKPDKPREALDCIEPGLTEFKSQLAQMQAGPKPYYESLITTQRQSMADELAACEKRLADARAGIAQTRKK